MATARNPIRVLIEAKQIAHDHGCFVVEKPQKNGTRYLVYRRAACGNIYQGFRGSPDAETSTKDSAARRMRFAALSARSPNSTERRP